VGIEFFYALPQNTYKQNGWALPNHFFSLNYV